MSFYTNKKLKLLWYYTKLNCIHKTFTVPCENSKSVSFASSRIKQNLVLFGLSKFAVKLIFWIALGLAFSACCLLKSTTIFYSIFWNSYSLTENQFYNHLLDQN